jgi:hypothetical protein
MSEWDEVDVDIDHSQTKTPLKRLGWPIWGGVAALAFALGFLWFFVFRRPEPPPEPEAAQEPVASAPVETSPPEPEPEPPLELPSLDESDDFVRTLVAALSSHAQLARWIMTEGLLRKFTAVVDNIAEGVSPAPHLSFLKPEGKFNAHYRSGWFYVDPASYDRYDLVADVISSLDVRATAELYRDLKPLIREAYADLGYPDRDFDETFSLALDRLLKVPALEGDVELDGTTVSYKYADPALERLSAAQKHFLRMGPRNVRMIQVKLAELKNHLRLPTVMSQ